MSTHVIPIFNNETDPFDGALRRAIRAPSSVGGWDAVAGTLVYTFTPDLTSQEQGTLADLLRTFSQHDVEITLAEYQGIKAQIAEIRSFRTRTLAQWNALTATQREADEVSYLNDLTDVLRALLRDS